MNNGKRLVSLVKGEDRYNNIYKALELIRDDLRVIENKRRILIKPNLTASNNVYANTDVSVIRAILDFFRKNCTDFKEKKFSIFEGSGSAYYEDITTREVFERFGYLELEKEYRNVRIECIEDFDEFIPVRIRSIAGWEEMKLVKHVVEDFDYKISVNLPKVHNYAIATFGIKNMMGVVRQEDKSMVHGLRTPNAPDAKTVFTYIPTWAIAWTRRRLPGLVDTVFKHSTSYQKAIQVIHHNVAGFSKVVWPDLVVLDGLYGMDGRGPVDGYPVRMNLAIASTDAVKADGVGARVMGLEPEDIGYLYYLKEEGMGDYSLDGLVGDRIEDVAVKFKLHPTYCIQRQWKERQYTEAEPTYSK
jgi:uncharacterized protein (DUF362 family)